MLNFSYISNKFRQNQTLRQVAFQIFSIVVLTILLLLDDHIFQFFNKINEARFFSKYMVLVFLLATIVTTVKQRWLIYTLFVILGILDLTQLCYLAYFGVYLHPTIVPLIFREGSEILTTGFAIFPKICYVFLAVLIPYSLAICYMRKYQYKFYTVSYSWLILLLFVSLIPLRCIKEVNVAKLLASPQDPSIYNGLKIYSTYLFNILPSTWNMDLNKVNFQEYQVTKTSSLGDKINIILVYGESFNYYNQSLYGYKNDTTPNLRQLAIAEPHNFIYKQGISGATTTLQSISAFFNLQREAENYKMQIEMPMNLFKLAKERGFKTIFISAQYDNLTHSLGRQYIDVFITLDDVKQQFQQQRDEILLELLKQQTLGGKNFIVLHQRILHSPYAQNYAHRQQQFSKFEFDYDNAMLYNDYLLKNIIDYARTQIAKPVYLFITSDHSELTGQKGIYGHLALIPEGADVPIMLYSTEPNAEVLVKLRQLFKPTHHELGLLIAELMGYKITNPNTPDNVFYINGSDALARYGYIKVTKDIEKQTVNYEIIENYKNKK